MANLRVELKSGIVVTAPAEVWIGAFLASMSEQDQSKIANRAMQYMADGQNIKKPYHQLIEVPPIPFRSQMGVPCATKTGQ